MKRARMRAREGPFEPHAAHLFIQLVSRGYERGSILITSNRSVGEWGEVFGDTVATAILDRLLHHSRVLTITGELSAAGEATRRSQAVGGAKRRHEAADDMSHASDTNYNTRGEGEPSGSASDYGRATIFPPSEASSSHPACTRGAAGRPPRGGRFQCRRGAILDVASQPA